MSNDFAALVEKYKKIQNARPSGVSSRSGTVTVQPSSSQEEEFFGLVNKYKNKKKNRVEDDIAPVSSRIESRLTVDDIAPVKKKEDDSLLDFFQKGSFEDGFDWHDIPTAILGTAGDIGLNVVKGVGGLAEGVVDLGSYLLSGAATLTGDDELAQQLKVHAQENYLDNKFKGAEDYLNQYSLLGRTSDAIMQGVGQVGSIIATGGLGAAAGLGAGGVTALTTGVMGLSGMGSGMGEAYKGGATDGEAVAYGAMAGAADAAWELVFGGLGKAVNAVGFSKGLSSLDDIAAKGVAKFINSPAGKNIAEAIVKSGFEGLEEVGAGFTQAIAKELTYKSEEEFEKIVKDENLLEQFLVGAFTSGIAQTPSVHSANKAGTDYVTGQTQNEQAVVKKEIENRIAEAEKDGKKLTAKEKSAIEAQVEKDMEKGYISTDTIEEVLGGEDYKKYKDTVDSENALEQQLKALQHEFDTLNKMKQGDMTGEQIDRRTELKEELAKLKETIESTKKNSSLDSLKKTLSESVSGMVKGDRLIESYNERSRRGQAFEADLTKYNDKQKAVVQKAIDSGILNNTNRTHEFVDMVAKISADKGVLFDFANNAKLKESGFAVDGKTVNGFYDPKNNNIVVNMDSAASRRFVVGHEITHVLEGTDLYAELQNTIFEYSKTKGDYQSRYDALSKLYEGIEGADINAELTADLVGEYLFNDPDFINNLSTNNRNVFEKIYDEIKYLLKVATAGSKEARELERVKKAFDKAYREGAQKNTADGGAKYAIAALDNGNVYVTASRNVIEGKTKAEQRKDISNFFSALLDGKPSLDIQTIEGDVLTITKKETAAKARDDYKTVGGQQVPMTDAEFTVKMHIESHIDEVAEVSKSMNGAKDNKNHPFAKDGFTYRRAYFEDFDGQYYEVTLSIGHNGTIATVYNVGKIKGSVPPSAKIIAVVGSKPLGGTLSKSDITQNGKKVNGQYSLSDSNGRQLTNEQQEFFKDSVVRDENGNLKVMYHGTSKGGHTVFDTYGSNYGLFGAGSYFTDSKTIGESYTKKGKGKNPQVYETYLNIKNPIDMDAAADPAAWAKAFPDADFPESGTNEQFYRAMEEYFEDNEYSKWEAADIAVEAMEGMGYDGITHIGGGRVNADGEQHQVYITFHPEQIKNTDNAKPTTNPDIRYSLSNAETDKTYLDAVKRGDTETAQKMVDEAAKKAGFTAKVYHGTQNFGFTKLKTSKSDDSISFFATEDIGIAGTYARIMVSDSRKINEKRVTLTQKSVPKIRRNIKFFALEYLREYTQELGHYDEWYMGPMELITENDFSDVASPSELVEYATLAADTISSVHGNIIDAIDHPRKGRRSQIPSISEETRQNLHNITQKYVQHISEILAPYSDMGVYGFYANTDNHLVVDAHGGIWSDIESDKLPVKDGGWTTREVAQYAKEKGYSGVTFKNLIDPANHAAFYPATIYAFFDPQAQVKSADPVTYDMMGRVIPLSKRFNAKNPDIRYSLSEDSNGKKLTEEQNEYFKDSVIRDSDGKLMPMYHGTMRGGFTVFGGKKDYWYFTNDKKYAYTFEGRKANGQLYPDTKEGIEKGYYNPQRYSVYLNVKNPFVTDDADIVEDALYWDKSLAGKLREQGYDALMLKDMSQVIVLNPNQIKNISNKKPTLDQDINRSLSDVSEQQKTVSDPLNELRLETAPVEEDIAPVAENATTTVKTDVEDMFPDEPTLQTELDSLIQEQEALETQMLDMANTGEFSDMESIDARWKEVRNRIADLENEISETESARLDSISDEDVPPEMDAPYFGEPNNESVPDPFMGRDMDEVGKNRKVKAYQYENPEVKPYFQEAANAMIGDLNETVRGEKIFNGDVYYESGGENGWMGTKRQTTEDIAWLKDTYGYTYDQIRDGVNAIIEDEGKENNAVSKRIEFLLHERLVNGYKGVWGDPIPPNQEYINFLKEREINEYSKEAFDSFMTTADQYVPEEDIAPVATPAAKTAEVTEDIAPTYDVVGQKNVPDGQQAFLPDAAVPEKITRKVLHQNIVENVKARFKANGFDFDKVLKDAKNLSTFATVDNTPQRVMEKALGYKAGQVLSDLTVNKVAQNETDGIKWLNSFTDRKNGLLAQISKQYNIKPGSKQSAAAQMYAEGFYVGENDEIISYGDRELAIDFPDVKVQQNIKGLANDPRIRKIYDETLAAINESRTRNAYPEIPRLDNYFLHFRAMEDTFSRLGLPFNPNDIRAKDLPTDLNGVTADLKPGQPYFASAMHRTGKRTSFDLLGGLEKYLSSAKNQIYHIDDIQTLRALRNYVADTYGQANGLEGLDALDEEAAQQRIEQVYNSHLSTFAKFLNEEANVLAGKTALIDRGLEGIIGRRGITFLNTLNGQVGKNMVGYNVSSSLTNFLPVVQTFAKTNKFDFTKAFAQTVGNKIGSVFGRNDGFMENSPVAIRRKGADTFYRTAWQKISDPGYALMSAVDDISTELIARTKYNEFTRKGMDSQKAHIETDKWVSRLMGDRSLGQQPQLYNSKMLGLLTKFQLEVRNQLDSQFYDTIQETKASNEDIKNGLLRNAKTAAKVGSTFFQLAVAQHLFGKAFESVAGYNPAFDIIEVLMKAFGWDDDEESEDTVLDNIEQGFFALLEDLPYTSTLTGGRIPISSALPITELIKGEDQYGNEKSRWDTLGEVAPYYLMPGGYGQVKKTVAGLKMFDDDLPIAGSYTDSGNLRFPVEDTPLNRAQAAIFGQWANENAGDYIDNKRSPLKEKQIQEFMDVDMPIRDYWEYREGLSGLDNLSEQADYINGLDLPISKKNLLINNLANRKEPIDLTGYDNFGGFEEFDFAVKNPEKYEIAQAVGGYENYMEYREGMKDMKLAEKVNYVAGLNLTTEQKNILINGETDRKEPIDLTGYENFTNFEEFEYAKNNPENYAVAKAVGGYDSYKQYSNALNDIKADKDKYGQSISGSRKAKVMDYIDNLDADYYTKLILYKSEYTSYDDENYEIIEYLNERDDISADEMRSILLKLGFKVDSEGYITW